MRKINFNMIFFNHIELGNDRIYNNCLWGLGDYFIGTTKVKIVNRLRINKRNPSVKSSFRLNHRKIPIRPLLFVLQFKRICQGIITVFCS